MLSDNLILSLCKISALVYRQNSFFVDAFSVKNEENQSDNDVKDTNVVKENEVIEENQENNKLSFYNIDKQPQFIESDIDCQCYVSVFNKNSILCAFRGTENSRDWLTDANIIRVPMNLNNLNDDERPLVHWGMLRQFRSVENKITEYIDNELATNKNIDSIVYTGHSLGGGLATIANMNYAHKYTNLKHMCVTFGAPRCGNSDFRKKFEKNCCFFKRYVNNYDPVPSLPFSLRYCHTCCSDHIEDDHIIDAETGISRFFWILYYKLRNFLGSQYDPVNDHSIENYYDKLCKLFDKDN